MNLTENQLAIIASHYIQDGYTFDEVVPMILEAKITQDNYSINLSWDNGTHDSFKKFRIPYGHGEFVDILKMDYLFMPLQKLA